MTEATTTLTRAALPDSYILTGGQPNQVGSA
jgi:hypothetical protein